MRRRWRVCLASSAMHVRPGPVQVHFGAGGEVHGSRYNCCGRRCQVCAFSSDWNGWLFGSLAMARLLSALQRRGDVTAVSCVRRRSTRKKNERANPKRRREVIRRATGPARGGDPYSCSLYPSVRRASPARTLRASRSPSTSRPMPKSRGACAPTYMQTRTS